MGGTVDDRPGHNAGTLRALVCGGLRLALLPWLWAQTFSLESWTFLAVVTVHILIPMLVVTVNWIAGPLLIWRLRGKRRRIVGLAFVVGAIVPGAFIASSYFYEPERPPYITMGE